MKPSGTSRFGWKASRSRPSVSTPPGVSGMRRPTTSLRSSNSSRVSDAWDAYLDRKSSGAICGLGCVVPRGFSAAYMYASGWVRGDRWSGLRPEAAQALEHLGDTYIEFCPMIGRITVFWIGDDPGWIKKHWIAHPQNLVTRTAGDFVFVTGQKLYFASPTITAPDAGVQR